MSHTHTHIHLADLPLLADPLAGEQSASADSPEAVALLDLLRDEHRAATRGGRNRRRTTRTVVGVAAAAALLLAMFAMPFGGSKSTAEALQEAIDLLAATQSGRREVVSTHTGAEGSVVERATMRWNGDDVHLRVDAEGDVLAGAVPMPERPASPDETPSVTRFIPATFEVYDIDGTIEMSINGSPFRPASGSNPPVATSTQELFERLVARASDLGACADDFAIASPVEDTARVTSYCGQGEGVDFYRGLSTQPPEVIVLQAGASAVRIDLDRATGIVVAVTVSVHDLVERHELPTIPPPPGFDAPEIAPAAFEVSFDSHIAAHQWFDLGEGIAIVRDG